MLITLRFISSAPSEGPLRGAGYCLQANNNLELIIQNFYC